MKIISLKEENVKRIKAVSIKPDGNMIVIGGDNGEGKSSVLDGIMYAMAGKSAIPSQPLRAGEKAGVVRLDLGDLVVTRTFKANGDSQISVTTQAGAKYSSPQAILDNLCGQLTFDPIAFAGMKPAVQLETLKGLVGLDFTELDMTRLALYSSRTDVNRDLKKKEAERDAIQVPAIKVEYVSISELLKKFKAAEDANATHDKKRKALEDIIEANQENDSVIKGLEMKLSEAKAWRKTFASDIKKLTKECAGLVDIDVSKIRQRIQDSEAINEQARKQSDREAMENAVSELQSKSEELTKRIAEIDSEKERQLREATFPVPGLSFNESGVLFNGIPFEQASSAEQLRVSVAMGIALNPKLRVILIRDGSLLDERNLKVIGEMAYKNDCQVWLERVGHGTECSVVIEDGMVKNN